MNHIYNIFFILFLVNYCIGFKFNNRINKNFNLNLFQYDLNEYSRYHQMELINWDENIDFNKFYYIVGHKNLDYDILVNEIKKMNFCCIFIPISTYKLKDIDYIFSNLNYIDLKPEINDIKKFNDFLIFDQNKYIGGLFEMYSILYKDT